MQLLKHPLFILAGSCYLINRFLLPFLDLSRYKIPYFNDVACLPVALSLALALQQLLFPASARQRLNPVQVTFAFIYFSVVFEGLLPSLSVHYTRDWWDLLAYASGGIIFYFFLNPKPTSSDAGLLPRNLPD